MQATQHTEPTEPVLEPIEARLLAEVGFMAAGYRHPLAPRILGALCMLRPKSSAPVLGLALYHLECGKPAEALALLQKGVAGSEQARGELRAFAAIALIALNRMNEAERVLNEVLSESPDDAPEARMALRMLEQHGLSRFHHGYSRAVHRPLLGAAD
jgi:thioredoxin-like negative regulator of GroEL